VNRRSATDLKTSDGGILTPTSVSVVERMNWADEERRARAISLAPGTSKISQRDQELTRLPKIVVKLEVTLVVLLAHSLDLSPEPTRKQVQPQGRFFLAASSAPSLCRKNLGMRNPDLTSVAWVRGGGVLRLLNS